MKGNSPSTVPAPLRTLPRGALGLGLALALVAQAAGPPGAALEALRAGDDAKARELLAAYAAGLRKDPGADAFAAPHLVTLGELHTEAFAFEQARRTYEQALALLARAAPELPDLVLEARIGLARAALLAGTPEPCRTALDQADAAAATLGARGRPGAARLAILRGELALAPGTEAAAAAAAPILEAARTAVDQAQAPPRVRAELLQAFGLSRLVQGDGRGAETYLVKGLGLAASVHGEASPRLARGLALLGAARRLQGEHVRAADAYRLALALRRRLLAATHPEVGTLAFGLAESLQAAYAYGDAEPAYRQALEAARADRRAAARYPDLVEERLAECLRAQRRFREAAVAFEALARRASDPAPKAYALSRVAECRAKAGEAAPALAAYRELLPLQEAALGADDPLLAATTSAMAALATELGRTDEAGALSARTRALVAAAKR